MGQGALGPVFQQSQFVVAHSPATGKVLPVFDGAVVRIQLEPQQVQEVFVVHEITNFGRRCGTAALFTGIVQQLQFLGIVWAQW